MKRIFVVLLLMVTGVSVNAQNSEEWTQQQQTKIKRLIEQIVANQFYLGHVKKGIQIVSDGLHTIRDIKGGDFKLHLGFIDSLKIVNPNIKRWAKVSAIIAMQVQLLSLRKQALDAVRRSGEFGEDELNYCTKLFDNLLEECVKGIDALLLVITNDELSMPDDARLQRIEVIYADMQEKTSFAASFNHAMRVLAMQRRTERTAIDYSKLLNSY